MRALLALIVVVLVLVFLGWVTVRTNGRNQATVTVDTDKIEKDTHEAVEKGGAVIEEAGRDLKAAVGQDHAEHPAVPARSTVPPGEAAPVE